MSDWIVEAVIQFVRSPMWTTPVQNFIDANCMIFDNEEEMKLEYTTVHQQFRTLIEDILESFLSELGISPETMLAACEANRAKEPRVAKFLQYLLTLDDFRAFRKIMIKRNVELETEAMEAWARVQAQHAADLAADAVPAQPHSQPSSQPASQTKSSPSSPSRDADDEELQLALTASLRASEMIMKQAELEDAELQAALALSIAEEEERIRREQRRLEEARDQRAEEERQLHAQLEGTQRQQAEAAAQKRQALEKAQHEMEVDQMKKEAELKKKELEVQALEQRVRNLTVASAEASKADQEGLHASAVPTKVVASAEEAGPAVLPTTDKPVATGGTATPKPVSAPAAMAAPAPAAKAAPASSAPAEVVHVSLTQKDPDSASVEAKHSERSLGELKARGGGFAKFGALPSLSFGELKSELKAAPAKPDDLQGTGTFKSKEQLAAEEAQAKAEVEARAKYMREQKEKLIAQKSKERGEAMAQYAHQNGLAVPAGSPAAPAGSPAATASPGVDDEHRQMTRALLRRFKDDIIRESSKQEP